MLSIPFFSVTVLESQVLQAPRSFRRTCPSLNPRNDFAVVLIVCEGVDFGAALALLVAFVCDRVYERLSGCHKFVDNGEYFGLDMRPGCGAVFRHCDVVQPKEDRGYAIDVEELGGERGGMWWRTGGTWV
jgi:hypothetical protein